MILSQANVTMETEGYPKSTRVQAYHVIKIEPRTTSVILGLHADILTQPIPRTTRSYAAHPNKKLYE